MTNNSAFCKNFSICRLLCVVFISLSQVVNAQDNNTYKAERNSFGVDTLQKIIVWNVSRLSKKSQPESSSLKYLSFGKNYEIVENDSLFSTHKTNILKNDQGQKYLLYKNKLPLVHLSSDQNIKDEPKVASEFVLYTKDTLISEIAGVEWRGNISLSFPKKTFDLEIWNQKTKPSSKDIKIKNLRTDDDWILDGIYNEPLRLRSYFCNKLWLKIYKPFYLDQQPKAKSGIDLFFTETFLNNEYQGIYTLSSQVDRKLLKLKDSDLTAIHGLLFKATSYEAGTKFEKPSSDYKNFLPHWSGFEAEYPFKDYKTDWKDLSELVNFISTSSDEDFRSQINEKVFIDNIIDYFLFVNLIRATDNLGKNYYVARYDKNQPFFMVPWDLDGVLGTIQDGKKIPTTNDILTNNLFDRLLQVNPNNYKKRLQDRWLSLRKKEFDSDYLKNEIKTLYYRFENQKIYEREFKKWETKEQLEEKKSYLLDWLERRLNFMDQYIKNL